LDEKCKKLEEIQREPTNTIGYKRKQANKEWFDEECATVKEEKNSFQRASHPNQNQRSQECLQTSLDKREALMKRL
jgi:hypothetical protein